MTATTRSPRVARGHPGLAARAYADRPRRRRSIGVPVEIVHIVTAGDRSSAAMDQIGGTGVFVSALRSALLARRDRHRRPLLQGPADGGGRRHRRRRRCRGARIRATRSSPATGSTLGELPTGFARRHRLAPARRPAACARLRPVDRAAAGQRRHPAASSRRGRPGRRGARTRRTAPARTRRRGHRDPRPDPDAARSGAGRAGHRMPRVGRRRPRPCCSHSRRRPDARAAIAAERASARRARGRLHRPGRRAGRDRRGRRSRPGSVPPWLGDGSGRPATPSGCRPRAR